MGAQQPKSFWIEGVIVIVYRGLQARWMPRGQRGGWRGGLDLTRTHSVASITRRCSGISSAPLEAHRANCGNRVRKRGNAWWFTRGLLVQTPDDYDAAIGITLNIMKAPCGRD